MSNFRADRVRKAHSILQVHRQKFFKFAMVFLSPIFLVLRMLHLPDPRDKETARYSRHADAKSWSTYFLGSTAFELLERFEGVNVPAQDRGVLLASNQVQYSLTYRAPERNGVMAACRELGVTLIAYSPMAQGLLTGARALQSPGRDL